MAVEARFFVQSITQRAHIPGAKEVALSVVTRGEENKTWAQYTPSGQITMSIKAGEAADQFELGKEYSVVFTKLPE